MISPSDPLEHLLDRVASRLRAILARFRIPVEDAEDLVQDALLLLVRKGATLRSPEAYLCTTLHYRCLMYWRRRRRERQETVTLDVLETLAEPQEPTQESAVLRRDLQKLLAALPGKARRLIRLRYGLGYTAREVAQRLNAPPDAIRQRSTYARGLFTRGLAHLDLIEPRWIEERRTP
jgi:RNA polymerase sigma factor (sigma-70 family)